MADYYAYARITNITPLSAAHPIEGSTPHRFTIDWEYTDPNRVYTKVEIYRYIGPGLTCVTSSNVDDRKENFVLINTIDIDNNSSKPTSYTDNLVGFYSDKTSNLIQTHSLTDAFNDKEVLDTIYYTQRTIWYRILTYVDGGFFDTVPYIMTSHADTKSVALHSTKTQVKHNILRYEGDVVWIAGMHIYYGANQSYMSRTSVDVNRLYDPIDGIRHRGTYGYGGWGWVTDRRNSQTYKFSLRDGRMLGAYNTAGQQTPKLIHGHGVCADKDTGDAIAIPFSSTADPASRMYRCNKNTETSLVALDNSDLTEDVSRCYGLTVQAGVPKTYYYVRWFSSTPDPYTVDKDWTPYGDNGTGGIWKVTVYGDKITSNEVIKYYAYDDNVDSDGFSPDNLYGGSLDISSAFGRPAGTIFNNITFPYGICSGPDGTIFWSRWLHRGLYYYDINGNYKVASGWGTSTTFLEQPPGSGTWQGYAVRTGEPWKPVLGAGNRGVTTDNTGVYPNTNNSYWVFMISTAWSGIDGAPYSVSNKTIGSPAFSIEFKDYFSWMDFATLGGSTVYGCAADSENNIYAAGVSLVKIYRLEDGTEFPYQARCRWPSVPLSAWGEDSFTNDPVIEWFLLRDDAEMDNAVSKSIQLYDGDGNLQTYNMTASAAWIALTDHRRYAGEVNLDNDGTCWRRNYSLGFVNSFVFGIAVSGMFEDLLQFSTGEPEDIVDDMYTKRKEDIRRWADTYGTDNANISGRRIYPKWDTDLGEYQGMPVTDTPYRMTLLRDFDIAGLSIQGPYAHVAGDSRGSRYYFFYSVDGSSLRSMGYTYMYSDFTGNVLINALDELPTRNSFGYPPPSIPDPILSVTDYTQFSPLDESRWGTYEEGTYNSAVTAITGYDDTVLKYRGDVTNSTFVVTGWEFKTDDYGYDFGSTTPNTNTINYNINNTYRTNLDYVEILTSEEYTYNDPSKYGLSARPPWWWDRPTPNHPAYGQFLPYLIAKSNNNLYTCEVVAATSNFAQVCVLERHPTPQFLINPTENKQLRKDWFGCPLSWKPDERFDKLDQLGAFGDPDSKNYLAYGVDPISSCILEKSISRTFPISAWELTIENFDPWYNRNESIDLDVDDYNGPDRADFVGTGAYPLTCDIFRYGLHKLTLNVKASNTDTMNPSTGDIGDETFVQYLCVKEFEPFSNFWIISGQTVPSNYSDENSTPVVPTVDVFPYDVPFHFISGYAPHLTVMFEDTSEAHTFPISSYNWNFGDYYAGCDNFEIVEAGNSVGGLGVVDIQNTPCWDTSAVNHRVEHTYVMPGFYDVTLTVEASNTSTPDLCARYVELEKFAVYVQEIPPQCDIKAASAYPDIFTNSIQFSSVAQPLTLWFSASDTIPGSFPICRVDWDFDDGSSIISITRKPESLTYVDGTETLYVSDYEMNTLDIFDPTNIAIRHTYETTVYDEQFTFSPSVTVYACNTNTAGKGCELTVGPISPPALSATNKPDNRHLIKSRYLNNDDDLLLVFEGDTGTTNTLYNIALSAGVSGLYLEPGRSLPKAAAPTIYPALTDQSATGDFWVVITNTVPGTQVYCIITGVYAGYYTEPIYVNTTPAAYVYALTIGDNYISSDIAEKIYTTV
jgi:hypothetical protein